MVDAIGENACPPGFLQGKAFAVSSATLGGGKRQTANAQGFETDAQCPAAAWNVAAGFVLHRWG